MPNTRGDYALVTSIVAALVAYASLGWMGLATPELEVASIAIGAVTAFVYYYSKI